MWGDWEFMQARSTIVGICSYPIPKIKICPSINFPISPAPVSPLHRLWIQMTKKSKKLNFSWGSVTGRCYSSYLRPKTTD